MYKDFEYFDINILNILIEKAAAEDHLGWLNKLQKLLGADLQRNFIFYIFLFFYILLIICRSFSVKICRERAEGDGNALSTFFINCASDLHSNSTVDHCLSASTGALYVFMHTTTGDANNCLYICKGLKKTLQIWNALNVIFQGNNFHVSEHNQDVLTPVFMFSCTEFVHILYAQTSSSTNTEQM